MFGLRNKTHPSSTAKKKKKCRTNLNKMATTWNCLFPCIIGILSFHIVAESVILKSHSCVLNRGSYMNVHVLLIFLNKLGKSDKMRGLPSILSLFRNEFN